MIASSTKILIIIKNCFPSSYFSCTLYYCIKVEDIMTAGENLRAKLGLHELE